ncbi:MAG: helix-turn-helix domain-containing protein [Lachnospiraceae bacterium]|nr:helix-turn-helix domain-containing protein [Lachnospiraceae bacterium]
MKINNMTDFGIAVRNRRKKLGYTQKYISEFTGLSVSFISDLENGKSTVEIGKAFELVKVLGLNIELIERG